MVPQTSPRAERDKKSQKSSRERSLPLIKVSGTSQRWNPGHRLDDARRALLADGGRRRRLARATGHFAPRP